VLVQLGLAGDVSIPQNMVVAKEIEIKGTFRFHEKFGLAVDLINKRTVDVKPLLTGVYGLGDALKAFEIAGDRSRSMKVQLSFRRRSSTPIVARGDPRRPIILERLIDREAYEAKRDWVELRRRNFIKRGYFSLPDAGRSRIRLGRSRSDVGDRTRSRRLAWFRSPACRSWRAIQKAGVKS